MPSHANDAMVKQASAERYTLCHNDLARGNIVIHSDSFEVKYILDWEYAGFFPPGFEFLYWRYSLQGYREWDNDPSGTMMASRRALLAREGEHALLTGVRCYTDEYCSQRRDAQRQLIAYTSSACVHCLAAILLAGNTDSLNPPSTYASHQVLSSMKD